MWRIRRPAFQAHPMIAARPGPSAVVAAVNAGRRDADHDPVRIIGIGQNSMQTESAGSRQPVRALGMVEQRLDRSEGLAAIIRAKQRRRIGAREHHVGPNQRCMVQGPNRVQ